VRYVSTRVRVAVLMEQPACHDSPLFGKQVPTKPLEIGGEIPARACVSTPIGGSTDEALMPR
jgi:hypothetical protein